MTATKPPRRRDVARHLLHPHQFRDSVRLNPQGWARNSALAGGLAGITVLIALPIVYYVSPWPHLVGFAALGAMVALFGRFETRSRRKRLVFLCALIQVGAVASVSFSAWVGLSLYGQLALLALICGVLFFLGMKLRVGPPGPLIFVFAASASVSPNGISLNQLGERIAAVALVAALAWGLSAAVERLRYVSDGAALPPSEEAPLKALIISASRCALGAGIAIAISQAMGGSHPAWAAMGVMAVLQGPHLHIVMNRALQRMAGTMVGAMLAWLLLSLLPEVLVVILVLAVLQTATEMVIGFNYAIGQVFVTPMALLMTWLGSAQLLGPEIAPERVLETCLGAVIGVLLAVVFSTLDDREYLAKVRAR